ncbi:hypothetical protein [Streptomyces sp. NBC_01174]|uniref:hypothetical protein n=1 Tax=Streptomyces sp. NBC_01174 TaxID=2903758 RepID=UPI002F910CF6|nr:hypothetical protein OG414_41000 [Streptomyces sp. NBC_01174]
MSAQPHQQHPPYADPYRVMPGDGPQTLAELRAALAIIAPAELVAFNARLDAARFGVDQDQVIAEARHLVALRTRPEVAAAVADSLAGRTETRPAADLLAFLDEEQGAA